MFYLSNNFLEGFIFVLFVNCIRLGLVIIESNECINGFIFVEFGNMIFDSLVVISISVSGKIFILCNIYLMLVFVFNDNNFIGNIFVLFF